jgi:hypothetical protein
MSCHSIIQLRVGIAQFCSLPTVLKHSHLSVGSYSDYRSIKSQIVVGFEALIKNRITGLDIAARVISKYQFPSTTMTSLTY